MNTHTLPFKSLGSKKLLLLFSKYVSIGILLSQKYSLTPDFFPFKSELNNQLITYRFLLSVSILINYIEAFLKELCIYSSCECMFLTELVKFQRYWHTFRVKQLLAQISLCSEGEAAFLLTSEKWAGNGQRGGVIIECLEHIKEIVADPLHSLSLARTHSTDQ